MKLCVKNKPLIEIATLLALLWVTTGCTMFLAPRDPFPATPPEPPIESSVPRELDKVTLPRYVIEPPDILLIEGVKLVPKSPHKIETFDVLLVRVSGGFQDQPINDAYSVDSDGSVNLGPTYGRIRVVDLTIEEAEDEIVEAAPAQAQAACVSQWSGIGGTLHSPGFCEPGQGEASA